jgi:hypothetical protein
MVNNINIVEILKPEIEKRLPSKTSNKTIFCTKKTNFKNLQYSLDALICTSSSDIPIPPNEWEYFNEIQFESPEKQMMKVQVARTYLSSKTPFVVFLNTGEFVAVLEILASPQAMGSNILLICLKITGTYLGKICYLSKLNENKDLIFVRCDEIIGSCYSIHIPAFMHPEASILAIMIPSASYFFTTSNTFQ